MITKRSRSTRSKDSASRHTSSRKATGSRKPRLKLESVRLLTEIDGYIRQYDVRGRMLATSASDVLDGAVFRCEIAELVRKRLIAIVHDEVGWNGTDNLCGTGWTVHLTERAMQAFWPGRISERVLPPRRNTRSRRI